MGKEDGLSRRTDWKIGVDKDNSNQIFKKARSKDEDVIKVVEEMKKAGVRELRGNE